MFEDDPRVLYISLHRLDIFPFKPEESDCDVVGSGPGIGHTVNIAWPRVKLLMRISPVYFLSKCTIFLIIFLERDG